MNDITSTATTPTARQVDAGSRAKGRPRRLPLNLRHLLLTAHVAMSVGLLGRLIAAATYDVVALTTAIALGVFKPGGPFRKPSVAASNP